MIEEGFIANYEDIVVREEDLLAANVELTEYHPMYNITVFNHPSRSMPPRQYLGGKSCMRTIQILSIG